jgi:type IV pilus assembly protein PilP
MTGLAACSEPNISDLKSYVAEVKSRQKGAVEPLPEIKAVEPFLFSADGLRDPFVQDEKAQQTEEMRVDNGIRPDQARPKEELEGYALDSLRMVGTVKLANEHWGLVQANDGTIHRVRAGNHAGQNYGKIVRVRDDGIELVEIIPDSPGTWRERPAFLAFTD